MLHGKSLMRQMATLVLACALAGSWILALPGCAKPNLYGPGRFHDITKVKAGMTESEVMNIMGTDYKSIWEDGLRGMDMGIHIWQYREGRVHFDQNGVVKVEPY